MTALDLRAVADPARLAALRASGLLDSPPEPSFDRLTRLAVRLLRCPVALISLVADDRQFFKSSLGLCEPWATARQTPLSHSFCRLVVESREPLVIPDARRDPRVAGNLAVRDLGVVAYLGVPLVSASGHILGSFCGIQGTPRDWTDEDLAAMVDLTASVTTEIELRRDIAGRERAARALRQSEAQAKKLALVASRTEDAAIVADAEGRVEWVNDAFVRITGYTLEEIRGKKPGQLLRGPATDPETSAEMGRRIRMGEPFEGEILNYAKDGREYWLALEIRPVRDDWGTLTNFIAIERDITERRRVEQELIRAKEAAEEATRVKSAFLANMSHEIRTPMNAILGLTELVLGTELADRQREPIELVRTSAESLLTVINDILDFSKVEAGKLRLDPAPFRIRAALDGLMPLLALKAHAKGLELVCLVDADVPDALVGDSGRLRHVLTNLVGNAVKFTEGGEVAVRVSVESADHSGIELRFSVTDTGPGIDAGSRRRIFEPFEQADGSTTRTHGGTGLGLAISRELAALMGGRLELESEPGVGSTFHLIARFARVATSDAAAGPGPRPLRGLRVLVVDDNTTTRESLVAILRSWQAEPSAVGSGAEALDALGRAAGRGRPFAVVLLDGTLQGMDGFELAGRIRSGPVDPAPKLLLMAPPGTDDPDRCRAVDLDGCLTKPVRQSALYDSLASAIDLGCEPGPRRAALAGVGPGEPRPADAPAPPRRSLRILLAEDHLVNQKVAAWMIEQLGHVVEVAPDGAAALKALGSGSFDLALVDVQMPVMDGLEAVAALRRRELVTGGRLPVIALTAHALQGDRERCLSAGFDDYLTKPLRRESLKRMLCRWT